MNDLTGTYDVFYSDGTAGTLAVSREGLMTVFSCICSHVSNDVLRLYCLCGGRAVPIGVMTPCSNNLTLSRAFSKNALAKMDLDHVDAAFLSKDGSVPRPLLAAAGLVPEAPAAAECEYQEQAFSAKQEGGAAEVSDNSKNQPPLSGEWTPEPEPWRLFDDEDISRSCRNITGAFVRFDGDVSYLAVPISPNEPFPPMPIFCFGTLERINGRDHVVFTMKDGRFV